MKGNCFSDVGVNFITVDNVEFCRKNELKIHRFLVVMTIRTTAHSTKAWYGRATGHAAGCPWKTSSISTVWTSASGRTSTATNDCGRCTIARSTTAVIREIPTTIPVLRCMWSADLRYVIKATKHSRLQPISKRLCRKGHSTCSKPMSVESQTSFWPISSCSKGKKFLEDHFKKTKDNIS